MSSISKKRQRTSKGSDGGIGRLPDPLMVCISEYLTCPSRMMLAAAMTPVTAVGGGRRPLTPASEAVLSSANFDGALDFEEVEEELAARLGDNDLGEVLTLVQRAGLVMKKLKLANCRGVIGHGLKPLSSSTTVEIIDLSLVGKFQRAEFQGEFKLDRDVVLPILQSVVDLDGSSLKRYYLPSRWIPSWREGKDKVDEQDQQKVEHLGDSLRRLLNGKHRCSNGGCGRVIRIGSDWRNGESHDISTCFECGDCYCQACEEDGDDHIECCAWCEKMYCAQCVPSDGWCDTHKCEFHGQSFCSGCTALVKCKYIDWCETICCLACADEHMVWCDACRQRVCKYHDWGEEPVIETCTNCQRKICRSCCEMSCCANCQYDCYGMMCNDCHPKNWECIWCEYDDSYDAFYHRLTSGQKCARCHKDSTTRCSYCRKLKLQLEDYNSPSISRSYWISKGFDDTYINEIERFLANMKKATLMLKSGDRVGWHFPSLRHGEGGRGDMVLLHDDALFPHWSELIDALQHYSHESKRRPNDMPFTLYAPKVQLHASVLTRLQSVIKEKGFALNLEE